MRIKGRIVAALLVCTLLAGLSGCKAEEAASNSSGSSQISGKSSVDLFAGGWKSYGEIAESSEAWFATDYWDDLTLGVAAAGTKKAGHCSVADGQDYYILESYYATGEPTYQTFYLIRVNMLSLEAEKLELDFQDSGKLESGTASELAELTEAIKKGQAKLVDLDVLDGKICLLASQWDEGRTARAYILRLNADGKVEGMTDLLPGLEQSGMLQGNGTPTSIVCDKEGCFYVNDSMGMGICVLDGEGTFLTWMNSFGSTDNVSFNSGRLPDGRPVFECTDSVSQTLTIFCFDGSSEKVLYRGQGGSAKTRYISAFGEILWLDYNGILRWNVAEGSCERFYPNNGLDASKCEAVLEGPDGEMVFACYDGEGTALYKLQSGEEPEQAEIRIFQLYGDEEMEQYAAEYSRKHPETVITVEVSEPGDDKGIILNRLMAQMSSGGGPDILVLHRSQLETLQDSGVLADLSGALSEELQEQIFASVLRQGSIGDGLYGIAREVSIGTLLVPENVWDGETWSFQDVLALMEERERRGEPYDRCISMNYSLTAEQMLFELALLDVGGEASSLVDLEQRKCYFNTPEFIGLLEACKKYGEKADSGDYMSDEECLEEVQSGKALARSVTGNLKSFSRYMAMFGEGYRCVGYPTEGGCGDRVSCYQLTAVNVGTQHYEIVMDFLNYLLSEEIQRKHGISTVRRDVLTTGVVENPSFSDTPVFMNDDSGYIPLEGKPDGTSYLQEYVEILDRGVPETWETVGIRSIVLEEAAAVFSGDKSAEEAALVIQNRVQLYLDER